MCLDSTFPLFKYVVGSIKVNSLNSWFRIVLVYMLLFEHLQVHMLDANDLVILTLSPVPFLMNSSQCRFHYGVYGVCSLQTFVSLTQDDFLFQLLLK